MACDLELLTEQARCLQCDLTPAMASAVEIVLLCAIRDGTPLTCDPQVLANEARCLLSCIPYGMLSAVKIALLCDIANGGGGSSSPAPSFPSGATHYWTMNEASGVRFDSIGTAHLAETVATGSAAGINGNAASFTWNTVNYGVLDGNVDIEIPSECSFSLFFRFAAVDSNQDYVLVGFTTDGAFGVLIRCSSDDIVFYHGSTALIQSFTPDTNVHHLCVTAIGTIATIYLDGVAVAIDPAATNDFSDWTAFTCYASNSGSTSGTVGLIDEMAVFPRALTPAEVLTIWNSGAGLFL